MKSFAYDLPMFLTTFKTLAASQALCCVSVNTADVV